MIHRNTYGALGNPAHEMISITYDQGYNENYFRTNPSSRDNVVFKVRIQGSTGSYDTEAKMKVASKTSIKYIVEMLDLNELKI